MIIVMTIILFIISRRDSVIIHWNHNNKDELSTNKQMNIYIYNTCHF